MIATIIEGKELLETVIASTVAGIGVTFAFSVGIWGIARSTDLGREDRHLAAGMAAAVAAVALLSTIAAVVAGVIVMTSK